MIEANNPEIDVEELMTKIREEVARRNHNFQPLSYSRSTIDLSAIGLTMNRVEALLRNAESRAYVRNKWPDKLNRFPFSLAKGTQKLGLKLLNFIFKDQREVNFNLIETLKQVLLVNQKLISQIQSLESQIETLTNNVENNLPLETDREKLQELDAFYAAFEDSFRGSQADILGRLKVYLPLIEEAKISSLEAPIIDVGCGRGEWLELLRDSGYKAKGIDINKVMLEQCRMKGLEVEELDALTYLKSLPDASVAGVTGFHIIEHLPFNVLMKFLNEVARVLKVGGVAILETPNPKNLVVGACNFYSDPTHHNPVFPETIQFLLQFQGLSEVRLLYLNPVENDFFNREDPKENMFHHWFFGPRDYAVVGYKK